MSKYIVTDPCYILPSDIWMECCQKGVDFNAVVTKALQEFSGDNKARAVGTGCGDWHNSVYSISFRKIVKSNFTADSGMVCFCKYNDTVEKALINNRIKDGCFAILDLEGAVTFGFDVGINRITKLYIWDEHDEIRTLS